MKAILITLRLSRQVNAEKIRRVCESVSTFETATVTWPGLNQPEHVAHMYQLNIWTKHPNTLLGYIKDFNEEWPGLQITVVPKQPAQHEHNFQYSVHCSICGEAQF